MMRIPGNKKGLFLFLLLFVPSALQSHPHIFIDNGITIVVVLTLYFILRHSYLCSLENINRVIRIVSHTLIASIGLLMFIAAIRDGRKKAISDSQRRHDQRLETQEPVFGSTGCGHCSLPRGHIDSAFLSFHGNIDNGSIFSACNGNRHGLNNLRSWRYCDSGQTGILQIPTRKLQNQTGSLNRPAAFRFSPYLLLTDQVKPDPSPTPKR